MRLKQCPKCDGEGQWWAGYYDGVYVEYCDHCHGTGYVRWQLAMRVWAIRNYIAYWKWRLAHLRLNEDDDIMF